MRCLTLGSLLVFAIGLAGCSSKKAVDTAGPAGASNMAANQQASGQPNVVQQPIAVPSSASPDQVVTVFLNALRSGDSPTTEALLTAKARQELAKHSLSLLGSVPDVGMLDVVDTKWADRSTRLR